MSLPGIETKPFTGGTQLSYGIGPSVVKIQVYQHGGITITIDRVGTEAGQPVIRTEIAHLAGDGPRVLRDLLNQAHPPLPEPKDYRK